MRRIYSISANSYKICTDGIFPCFGDWCRYNTIQTMTSRYCSSSIFFLAVAGSCFWELKMVKGYTFCEWIALNMSQIKNHTCFALKLNILFGFQFFISNSMNYARLMRIVSLFCLIDLRIPDESRNGLHSSHLGSERSYVKRIESSQHLCGLTL